MKNLQKNIEEIDVHLTKLFNNTISNEKIEEVRYEKHGDQYCKNYEQGFLSKYLAEILTNKDELKLGMEEQSNLKTSVYCSFFCAFVTSFFIFMFMGALFFDLDFMYIIAILSFSLIFSGLNIFRYFKIKKEIKFRNKYIEMNLKYDRDSMLNLFLNNKLVSVEKYLLNEKLKKEDLEDILKFIKHYMSVEDITKWLIDNKINDVSEPMVLYKLLFKIKSEKMIELQEIEKEKNKMEIIEKNSRILDSVN